jgi:Holliday junction DNA helicase RuvB
MSADPALTPDLDPALDLLEAVARPSEAGSERALRPSKLAEYVGQARMRGIIEIMLEAAKTRNAALDHVLLYGPPGLGKTTMANVIAAELGVRIHHASGPSIEKAGDLVAILVGLAPRDVLFIDEIHRLRSDLEEILYAALEDYAVDIVSGAGSGAKVLRLNLAPFTCVGATTRAGTITGPLRDRFGVSFRLEFYSEPELAAIIERSANLLHTPVEPAAVALLARRARGTPRIANRLLRRSGDEALVAGSATITEALATKMMSRLHIDAEGLDAADRAYLSTLRDTFAGGPAGVAALAASLSEDPMTLEDLVEPYLLRLGLIARTQRGRVITKAGRAHLKSSAFGA